MHQVVEYKTNKFVLNKDIFEYVIKRIDWRKDIGQQRKTICQNL